MYFLRQNDYINVIGCDFDPEQIRLARLLDLPGFEGDAFTILYNVSIRYYCILSVDFIEHLSKDQAMIFLQLCYAKLNTGGALILRTLSSDGPFGAHDRDNDLTHKFAMTSNVLETLLHMTGFEQVNILDERSQPYNVLNRIRLLAYYPTKWLSSVWLMLLGLSLPRLWSKSMWGVGKRL